ncbi:MAG: tetratricopeptide repeat protein [Actinobacteria bacterium]|nr:tetratricopeptide repeat protein [Actinomycetota bacterium]
MEIGIGTKLGRYEITSLVGQGGMATVYEAHDPMLDRSVAIKVLHPHLAMDKAFVGRFRHEAQAIAALRHPNIIRVFDFGVEGDGYYMVMEFMDGGTLAALLKNTKERRQVLSADQVLKLFVPLCSAIDYAAGQGMIHRDIKPSNIMLTSAGDPILTDYGIAKMLGVTSFTDSGMVMGSAHYMAPEQAQGLGADVKTDIYSLGIVLFQALTGRVPFDGDTTGSVIAQQIAAPVPSLASINPALSPAVQSVLEGALAKDPGKRYQSAAGLASGLRAALGQPSAAVPAMTAAGPPGTTRLEPFPQQAPAAASAPPGPPPASEPQMAPDQPYPYPYADWGQPSQPTLAERLHKRLGIIVAAAAVVVVVAILAGVLGTRGGKPTTTTATSSLASTVSSILSSVASGPLTTGGSSPGSTVVPDPSPQTAALRAEAGSLMMAGKFNEAIAKYTEALQTNPKDTAARIGLGIAYYHLPKSSRLGAQQLESAVTSDPGNVQAWAYLAACRYSFIDQSDGRDFTSAEEACNKALELDPNSALAHAFLGEIYSAMGRSDEALAEVSRAISLAPNEPGVLVAMGAVKADADDWQAAVSNFKKAVTLAPNYPDYVLYLATAYRQTEQYDSAIEYCRNALQLDEGYEYQAYRGIGRALWDKGDYEGAETNLWQAIDLDDTDAFSHWALGGVYYDQADYEGALPELERAVALRPENAGFLEWEGACYMALERWKEARAALEKAVELDPSRTGAQELLDQLTADGH